MYHSCNTIHQIMMRARGQENPDCQFLASTIGCVIDITQPLFRQKDNSYIVQVKLIDETFNSLTDTQFLTKYLSVHLITSNVADLRLTSKIGDFLYLHKFMFSTWNNVKLKAKFYGSFESVYQIVSGEIQDDQEWKMECRLGKDNAPANIQELTMRIVELKNWLMIQFRDVFKPFIGVKIINNYCTLIEPFSMILKGTKHYLFLEDENKNPFYIDIKPFSYLFVKQGEWLYLRGIKQINLDKQIVFSETGRFIALPPFFSEDYEYQANYKAIYRKTNKLAHQKKESSSLTQIIFSENKISTVKQLFELQDQYQATSKKDEILLQNNYLVKGTVVKYTGKIKLYHKDYGMIVHDNYLAEIPIQQKNSTVEDKKLSYIYEGQIHLVDQSILYKKQVLRIMIFTNDSKSTFFQDEELEELSKFIAHSNVEKKKQETLQLVNSKLEKLKQLSTIQNPAAFVLEPIRSDKLIFRVINTKIP